MFVFVFAIIVGIFELVFLGTQPLHNIRIFGIAWTIFIFLVALLSILLIVREIRIEKLKLFWKKEKKKRRVIILEILKISIGITYVLGIFGMLLQGIFPIYIGILINGFIFAPIGLLLHGTCLEKLEV